MRIGTFAIASAVMALGLAGAARAQGPLNDVVTLNLPYTVTLGDRTLQPGDYYIRELPSTSKSYVLLIYSDNGAKFETSVITIPTVAPVNTPDSTKVVLHHYGNDYYFDKIWIEGKNYGYEFPLPPNVKQRELEAMGSVTVAGTLQPPPAPQPVVAQAPPPPPPPAQEAQPEAQPAPQPAPEPMAQNTPPPAPEPAPAPEQNESNRSMPETSAGWVMMLLGGGTLSGLGMMLNRKR